MIDTHCHLNFHQYDEDRDAVVQRAHNAGVAQIIIPAVDIETSHQAIELTQQYDGIFAAVGIHPNSTVGFDNNVLKQIRELAANPSVIAIGEIGLDYYWDKSPKSTQIPALEAQLELAAELELPVIIHNRESSEDIIEILEKWATTLPESIKNRPGVLHSFSADASIAKRALDAGFYLGFTGPLTFKKAIDLRQVAGDTPINRILVETDGPYLTPHPYRGKRNEPGYIPYIVEQLAELKNLPVDEVGSITHANARRLFHLPQS